MTTSVSAQSRTVDRVLIAMASQSLPAISKEQFYVSLSRGRHWARIYTDDKEALAKAVQRSDEQVSATEVAAKTKARLERQARLLKHVMFLKRIERSESNSQGREMDRAAIGRGEIHERAAISHER